MILKSKDSYDVYISDRLLNLAEVESISHNSYRTTVKFFKVLEKKNINIALTKDQHNALIEQLVSNYDIAKLTEETNTQKKTNTRHLRVDELDSTKKILCPKES